MPSKQRECPGCGGSMSPKAERCRRCKPSYERTPEMNQAMSAALSGRPKPWLSGKKRPRHSAWMKKWWTKERRLAHREKLLNPEARYHGLSSRQAAALVKTAGECSSCGHDGSQSRLGIHHRNRDKHDQSPGNLVVLCHRCHIREHSESGEVGWAAYWKKRRNSGRS